METFVLRNYDFIKLYRKQWWLVSIEPTILYYLIFHPSHIYLLFSLNHWTFDARSDEFVFFELTTSIVTGSSGGIYSSNWIIGYENSNLAIIRPIVNEVVDIIPPIIIPLLFSDIIYLYVAKIFTIFWKSASVFVLILVNICWKEKRGNLSWQTEM